MEELFTNLHNLISELSNVENDFTKYKNARDARKVLANISLEAKILRKQILSIRKSN